MRVLVTGGAGRVGKPLTERLVGHGWDVRAVGIESGTPIEGVEYIPCDILDYAALREQMRGCQVVVHLAAIASPLGAPGTRVFDVNVAGTFNLFEAAAAEGIQRVVQASSINAFGCAWSIGDMKVNYLPLDEQHPSYTTDVYSFSKQMIEDVGAYHWRREGISSAAMRFPAVLSPAQRVSDQGREQRARLRAMLDELGAPEAERSARLAEARRALEFRAKRPLEFGYTGEKLPPDDLLLRTYAFDRFNFWAYVDERDAAQAMEKALTADFEGSHALFINAEQNSLGYDSATLARLFFPEVPAQLEGSDSLVSIERARALIGYAPEY